jgi:DNA-binding CsgD family transcriptional regulator
MDHNRPTAPPVRPPDGPNPIGESRASTYDSSDAHTPAQRPELTARQLDVLRLAAQGHTNARIGAALWIDTNTVAGHLTAARRTLGAHDRTHAVALAIHHRLIHPDRQDHDDRGQHPAIAAWGNAHDRAERAIRIAVQLENENARLTRDCQLWADAVATSERVRARQESDADRYEAELRAARDQHADILREYIQLADVTHAHRIQGGHDSLGENLSCAGCALRDKARTALAAQLQDGPTSGADATTGA